MKKTIVYLVYFLVFTSFIQAQRLESKKEILEEISIDGSEVGNNLSIKNFNGYVKIEGYSGNTIKLNVQKIIRADNTSDLKKGEKEVGINIEKEKTGIIIFPKTPFIRLDKNGLIYEHETNADDFNYNFVLNLTLKIPNKTNLELANGSEGNIVVENVNSSHIKVSNMDGDITLKNVLGETDVETMVGDIFVTYVENPKLPSRYFSSNGNINVAFLDNLSAVLEFKSTGGKINTDFEVVNKVLKKDIITDNDSTTNTTLVTHNPLLTIGKGGITHTFQTFQGDISIIKRKR